MLITSSVLLAASSGFVLGATAGQLSDAFLLAAAGAIAVASVGCLVGGIKWLWNLDKKMTALSSTMVAGFLEAHGRHAALEEKVEQGFTQATQDRDRMGLHLSEIGLRVATVEHELAPNDGHSARDAINRIDRRSRKVAEQVGALDYDDEEAI